MNKGKAALVPKEDDTKLQNITIWNSMEIIQTIGRFLSSNISKAPSTKKK